MKNKDIYYSLRRNGFRKNRPGVHFVIDELMKKLKPEEIINMLNINYGEFNYISKKIKSTKFVIIKGVKDLYYCSDYVNELVRRIKEKFSNDITFDLECSSFSGDKIDFDCNMYALVDCYEANSENDISSRVDDYFIKNESSLLVFIINKEEEAHYSRSFTINRNIGKGKIFIGAKRDYFDDRDFSDEKNASVKRICLKHGMRLY